MVNVLIVEDSRISRETFERRLAESPDYLVIASIENAANAEILCMRNKVDLILMDVCTADEESGLVAAVKIKKHYPQVKIIIMTSMPEHSFLQKARENGCDGFWYKEQGDISLITICDKVMKGETVWPEESPSVMIGLAHSYEFTERELDVIRSMAQGNKYEEIAEELSISSNTIKYHIKNILRKTGFRSTIQLVAEVVEKGLILPKY